MKPKTIIPLVLGVCVGGVAIKIVVDVVKNAQGATEANMTRCVVAKMDIGFAEEIGSGKLELRDWPKNSLPAQYFSSIEELETRVTNMFIPRDIPVYPSMLAAPGTPPGIQTRIKPGFRAVSVPIDEVTGVAYQLQPGDHVDVLAIVQRQTANGDTENMSRIILQNVEIATIGRTMHAGRPGEAPKSVARSATLLLKPEEVTQLHLAQSNRGKISLALRGNLDSGEEQDVPGATNEQLAGAVEAFMDSTSDPVPLVAAAPLLNPVKSQAAVSPEWVVRVLSGNDMRLVKYRRFGNSWLPMDEEAGQFSPPSTDLAGPQGAPAQTRENPPADQVDYGQEG